MLWLAVLDEVEPAVGPILDAEGPHGVDVVHPGHERHGLVEVVAEAGILKTERSDVASTYTARTVTELPVLNRRFTNFQLMTPGVVAFPTSLTAASAENPQGSYRMLVNGQSFAGTSHNMTATADSEIPAGRMVKVVAVAGGNLVVTLNPVTSTEGARSDA